MKYEVWHKLCFINCIFQPSLSLTKSDVGKIMFALASRAISLVLVLH